jgi:hypothetical protein
VRTNPPAVAAGLALAVLVLGGVRLGSAEAVPRVSQVVDRTLLCATSPLGGLRGVEVRAHAGIRQGGSSWKQLPFAVISTGAVGSRLTALDNSLAWITAGRPSGTTTMDTGFNLSWPHTSGTLALNRRLCRTAPVRIPLTSSGLQGGPAGVFGDAFDCSTTRRVLVRVRAVIEGSSRLHGDAGFVKTNTPLREARLAMRTASGRPLLFAEVLESGKARLLTARSCVAD